MESEKKYLKMKSLNRHGVLFSMKTYDMINCKFCITTEGPKLKKVRSPSYNNIYIFVRSSLADQHKLNNLVTKLLAGSNNQSTTLEYVNH